MEIFVLFILVCPILWCMYYDSIQKRKKMEIMRMNIAGVTFENRQSVILSLYYSKKLEPKQELVLIREPNNKYHSNAIAVFHPTGKQLGYIPKEIATDMATVIDGGERYYAKVVEVKGIGMGKNVGISIIVQLLEFDNLGFDSNGFDRSGYNKDGYDQFGYDKNGYNEDGYDKDGYDKYGYDKFKYNRNGYNDEGYDRDGYDQNGYDKDGYDWEGYNKDGYDKDAYNKYGINKKGYDRLGNFNLRAQLEYKNLLKKEYEGKDEQGIFVILNEEYEIIENIIKAYIEDKIDFGLYDIPKKYEGIGRLERGFNYLSDIVNDFYLDNHRIITQIKDSVNYKKIQENNLRINDFMKKANNYLKKKQQERDEKWGNRVTGLSYDMSLPVWNDNYDFEEERYNFSYDLYDYISNKLDD